MDLKFIDRFFSDYIHCNISSKAEKLNVSTWKIMVNGSLSTLFSLISVKHSFRFWLHMPTLYTYSFILQQVKKLSGVVKEWNSAIKQSATWFSFLLKPQYFILNLKNCSILAWCHRFKLFKILPISMRNTI